MSFTIDEIMDVIKIVKECKDVEVHIETGDIKFSVYKGDVRSVSGASQDLPRAGAQEPRREADAASMEATADTGRTPTTSSIPPDGRAKGQSAVAEATPAEPATGSNLPKAEAASVTPPSPASERTGEERAEEGLVPIKATVASVFYRRPQPAEPPFVEVGDSVQEDTVICLLEVMKCFRQVTAGVHGVIEKICVDSNSLVEKDTTLFLIRPA